MSSEAKRVVVTGMGVVTSIGTGIDAYWESLLQGKSGIRRVERFDASPYSCQVASEVWDFDPLNYLDRKEVKRNDRYTHFAIAASRLAVEDGALDISKVNSEQFGVIIGSGIGGMETIEKQTLTLYEKGPRKVSPFMIPCLISNIASGVVAIEMGALGPNYAPVSACASSTHALGQALKIIRNGEADVILAGGSEAAITQVGFAGFCSMKAMSTSFNDDPERASRPFDAQRDGFVMGEGAGVILIESLEHAQARGAKIYCELAGYGATCDAYHITSPHPEGLGLSNCLRQALKDANVQSDEIDYINAHGTSTSYNDKFETLSIKNVFGEEKSRELLVSSSKSMTGHLLGAAGAIEAAAAIKAIQTSQVPPTINQEESDPDCDLNYVPNEKVKKEVNVALSQNLGFGGHNAAVVMKKFS